MEHRSNTDESQAEERVSRSVLIRVPSVFHPWLLDRSASMASLEKLPGKLLHADVTEQIIGAAFEVHRTLGYGFLEKVYQRSMQVELASRGFTAAIEHPIEVFYKGAKVGFYEADLFVDGRVMVEVKVAKAYNLAGRGATAQSAQGHGHEGGFADNFWREKVEFKRFVF
jgi:GxxExxY protein